MAANARGNPARWWQSRSCGGVSRSPRLLFVSPVRRWSSRAALLILVTGFGGIWYATNPARISRLSEVLLSRVLGGQVKVRTGHLSFSGTLLLSGVEVGAAEGDAGPAGSVPIFSADEIEVRFDWLSLLSGKLSATQLVATTPVFRPIEDRETGRWNYERLRPGGRKGVPRAGSAALSLPVVVLRDARVQWGEVRQGRVEQTAETMMDGQLVPDATAAALYHFQFVQVAPAQTGASAGISAETVSPGLPADANPTAIPPTGPGAPESSGAEGAASAAAFGPATAPVAALVNRANVGAVMTGTWDISTSFFSATTNNVVMSEALKSGLPRQAREFCEEHHVTGRLSQVSMTYNPHDGLGISVAFDGASDGVSMLWMVEPEQGIGMGEDRPAYPLDVKNVRGRVVFTQNPAGMRLMDLRGEVLGYSFVANCEVDGPSFDSPFTLDLKFPGAVVGEHYPPLFTAFLGSQDLLQRIEPHGAMDIAMSINRTVARGPLQFAGTVDCHDARMRFAHFPFPLDHVNGLMTFDQKSVTFHDVTVHGDESDARINGSAGTTWSNRFIDFTITSDNVTFDDRIAACLQDKFRDIWDLFSLNLHGGLVCTVKRSNALFEQPKVVVDLTLDRGSGYIRSVPYEMSDARGHLHFEADQTQVDNLRVSTGADHSGVVVLNGVVHHPSGDFANLRPELKVSADVPIDQKLLQALPGEYSEKLKAVALGGRLGFVGTAQRAAGGGIGVSGAGGAGDAQGGAAAAALQMSGVVKWTNGTLKTVLGATEHEAGQAVALSGITAEAAITPDLVALKQFVGNLELPGDGAGRTNGGNVDLRFTGKLLPATMAGEFSGTAEGKGVALPAQAPSFFPKNLADVWKEYAPRGTIDLTLASSVRVGAADPAQGITTLKPALEISPALAVETYDVSVLAHDISLRKKDWPAPVEHLIGTVHVASNPDKPLLVQMREMSAVTDGMRLVWGGELVPQTGAVSLAGKATADAWPLKWLEKLPAGVVNNLDLKRAGTVVTAQVRGLSRAGEGKPWVFEGSLDTTNLAVTGPLAIASEQATLTGKGAYDPAAADPAAAFDLTGAVSARALGLSNRTIETLTANVNISGARHEIAVSEISGNVAGGRLQGTIQFHTVAEAATTQAEVAATQPLTQPSVARVPTTAPLGTMPADRLESGYVAELTLSDAELGRLMLPAGATEEERKKVGTGRVTASLALKETFGAHPDRTGRGELDVRDGNIFDVPLSMGLMQVVTLRLPVARSFQKATMSYYLRDNEITFERILLESQGINLAGLGTVSMKDKALNLSFVTETPHEFFVPILSPIVQVTRNGLLQVSVTGTLDDPKVVPVPLSAISNTLRALLVRPQADGRR